MIILTYNLPKLLQMNYKTMVYLILFNVIGSSIMANNFKYIFKCNIHYNINLF